jgi:hypothetical protein
MKKIIIGPGLMASFITLLLTCLSGIALYGQTQFVKHYNNPVAESDAYIKFSNNFAINGSTDNSFRILSASIKSRRDVGKFLELCFLKDDGTGRPTSPMKEILLDANVGDDPKVLEIISNSQGHYVFIRSGGEKESLTYLHLNAVGNLIAVRKLSCTTTPANTSNGSLQINQVIPIPNNSVALVGTLRDVIQIQSRVYFAIINLTSHTVTSQQQYDIDIDLDNTPDNLTGLSIYRYGTSGYFLAGISGDGNSNARPFLMRVGGTGIFSWIRNWQDSGGASLGIARSDDTRALPNMRLFAASDGSGSTYYGLLYGSAGNELRLIRYNPNVISGSGIVDVRMIYDVTFGLWGSAFMTDLDQVLTYPTIAVSYVHQLNSDGDSGSSFMVYNLLTHTAYYYNIFDGTSPVSGMRHAFTRSIVDHQPGSPGNKIPLYAGSESRDVASTQFLHHLYVRTAPIGSNPLETFGCHYDTPLTIFDIEDPIDYNLGTLEGQSTFTLSFTTVFFSGAIDIGFLAGEYCNGNGTFQVLGNNEVTDRSEEIANNSEEMLNEVERVRIYSFSGQMLYEASNLTIRECKDILIGQPGGLYVMERVMRNGERTTEKIFHGQR